MAATASAGGIGMPIKTSQDGEERCYWSALFRYVEMNRQEPVLAHFGKLQIMNIVRLLNDIARIKGDVENNKSTSTEQMDLLGQRLHQYADAIRDYQYLTTMDVIPESQATSKRESLQTEFPSIGTPYPGKKNEPYDTMYLSLQKKAIQSSDGIRDFLRKVLPRRLSWTEREREERRKDYSRGEPPEIHSKFLDALARFIVGVAGGSALIVPMIIMVLNPSLTKSLVTVSVAVILFALVLGYVFETDNGNTITATATYAAVLVVFVGTSGSVGG